MAQIVLNGTSLHCDDVVRFATGDVKVSVDPASLDAAEAAWKLQREAVARRAVYGRTTGVGANKTVLTEGGADDGLRLMRSHAGGVGELMPSAFVRAMLLVRLNQLAAGRSGVHPRLLVHRRDCSSRSSAKPCFACASDVSSLSIHSEMRDRPLARATAYAGA
jgi:histidine ammonia-lyase